MRNRTIPKTIQRWIDKHPHIVEEAHMEADGYGDSEGHPYSIWCYFRHGYINEMSETHCIHAMRVQDFMDEVQSIKPCNCEQCEPAPRLCDE